MASNKYRRLASIASHLNKPLRTAIYKHIGICGNCNMAKDIFMDFPTRLKIGDGSFINHHVMFNIGDGNATITLHENVYIAPQCSFYCVSHEIGDSERRARKNTYNSIEIGKGTWVGANTVILPNVTIGKGCIIGANSTVNKDIPDNELWAGSPARFIKKLD